MKNELEFFDDLSTNDDLPPYKRLALAMMAQAAIDATGANMEKAAEAREWINSPDCGELAELLNWQDATLPNLATLANQAQRKPRKNAIVRPQKAPKRAYRRRVNKNQPEQRKEQIMTHYPHLEAHWQAEEAALAAQAEAEEAARKAAQDAAYRAQVDRILAEVRGMYERMEPDYAERQELAAAAAKTLAKLARLNERLQGGETEARRMLVTYVRCDAAQAQELTLTLRGACPAPYDPGIQPADNAEATAAAAVTGVLRGVIQPGRVGMCSV